MHKSRWGGKMDGMEPWALVGIIAVAIVAAVCILAFC